MAAAPEQEAEEWPLPRRFGRYVLFDRIGRGGMAEIFLARGTTQMGAARLAVVKLVLPRFAEDPRFANMLISEAKLAAKLSHASVVQTFDLGREEGRLYIAMEYVEGFDLNQLLKRLAQKKLGLPAEYGFFVVAAMLRALDYAHRRADENGVPLGIVHRDVSPSNVLVSLEGEVKLCDFGIARAMLDTGELPADAMEGKAGYMAPEHARGEKVDGRADVFAASIVLWEMMAGRRMYKSQPGKDMYDVAREAVVPALPDRGLPDHPRLAAIVARGLATDREARYPTAGAMLRDLEDYAAAARLVASPMKFGQFLQEHFERDLVDARRAREQAAAALQGSEPVEVIPELPADFAEDDETVLRVPTDVGDASAVRLRPDAAPGATPGATPGAPPGAPPGATPGVPAASPMRVPVRRALTAPTASDEIATASGKGGMTVGAFLGIALAVLVLLGIGIWLAVK